MASKSPEEISEIHKKIGEASVRNWNNLSEDTKRKRAKIFRENALK